MKPLGIFGTSGFARETRDVAHELGRRAIFVARDEAELAAWTMEEEVILERDASKYRDMQYAIGIGDNALRQKVYQRFRNELEFVNLVHPSATFGKGQREALATRRGVTVCAGARFMSDITVGDFTVFSLNTTIGHDSIIEGFVLIAPGANISGHVHIGARCWVGTGAAVNQGSALKKLAIGADTVIGSGAVVVRDCEANAVYAGVPAKKIK